MASRILSSTPVPADTQSVLPRIAGVPWWGAVLIAAVFTSVGATIDVLVNSSLGPTYNGFFLVGCVLAVLAVRRRALFTAAVQPPLITVTIGMISLYAMVLSSNDSSAPQGMRKAVLKVALPFSNMFPWILGTFVLCVLIAVVRWVVTRSATVADRPQRTSHRSGERSKTKTARPATSSGAPKKAAPDGKKASRDGKKAAQARRGRGESGKATSGKSPRGKTTPGTTTPAKVRSRQPESAQPPAARKKTAPKKAGATSAARPTSRPRPQPSDPAQRPAPKQPSAQKPATQKPAAQSPAPPPRAPQKAAPRPQSTPGAEGPSTGTARPVRRSPSIIGQGDRPVRRAEPQVIPPRPDPAGRPRRTAGQQLREQQGTDDVPVQRRD